MELKKHLLLRVFFTDCWDSGGPQCTMLADHTDKATTEAWVPWKTEPEAKRTCVTSLLEREVEWSKVGEEQAKSLMKY